MLLLPAEWSSRLAWCLRCVLLCWFFVIANPTQANEPLLWQDTAPDRQAMLHHLRYVMPGMQHMELAEILSLSEEQWKDTTNIPRLIIFSPRQMLWYRLPLHNATTQVQTLVLINKFLAADSTKGFLLDHSKPDAEHIITLPQAHHAPNQLRLTIEPDHTYTLYFKVSGYHSNKTPFELLPATAFEKRLQKRHWYFGIINGAVIGLLLYSALVWFGTRQRQYLAYMTTVFANLLTMLAYQGAGRTNHELLQHTLSDLSLALPVTVSASFIWFFREFSDTKTYHPALDRALRACSYLLLLTISAFLLGATMFITSPMYGILSLFGGGAMLYIIANMQRYSLTVRLLMLAGLMLPIVSVALVVYLLASNIHPSDYFLTTQTIEVLKILIMALAMAFKIRDMQREHKLLQDDAAEKDVIHKAQTRLLSHLNHEFRTPLNGILAASELLLSRNHPTQDNTVGLIYQTALPLKTLIENLINVQYPSSSSTIPAPVRFSLEQLLQECTDLFLPAAHKQDNRLYFLIDHNTPVDLSGQPNPLRQMLLNLLSNAFKVTRHGNVGIRVYRDSADHDLIHFDVHDDGEPVPDILRDRLFGQFEQGKAGTSTTPGTGLGLSIVQTLSRQLGGSCGYKLYDDTQPALGKVFWFTVRFAPSLPVLHTPPACFDKRRILIADSHPLFAEACRHAIGLQAAAIHLAHNAVTLRDTAIRSHFDIAIIEHSLLNTSADHSYLEDVSHVYVYSDTVANSTGTVPDNQTPWPIAARPASLRKMTLQIANLIQQRNTPLHQAEKHNTAMTDQQKQVKPTVMIVEDNQTNQIIMMEILKRFPVDVEVFSNGQEAEAAFLAKAGQQSRYACIFMDCEMPVQDGFDTARHIRQYERDHQLARTPIVAVTAHSEPGYREMSLLAGMDNYLNKPVSVVQIHGCLQQLSLVPR